MCGLPPAGRAGSSHGVRHIKSGRKSGFTLIEALVAILVISMTAGIFFSLIPMAFKTGKMVGSHQQAASLVQHKIDQMRGVGFGRLNYSELVDAGVIDPTPASSPFSFRDVDGLGSIYAKPTGTITIQNLSASLKKVRVDLAWTGTPIKQGQGSVSVSAIIGKG